MINRRDLLIAGACVGALATAEALRPRTKLQLLANAKLDDLVPVRFGDWSAEDGGEFVVPQTPGSLADKLYNDTITRRYRHSDGGAPVMLLIAYGAAQNDLLQLHRPESCYPAVGFAITHRAFEALRIAPNAVLPAVALTARSGARIEDIVYWTRLGEYLPRTAGEQRRDRLATAMAGLIGDGALIRASVIRERETPDFARVDAFLKDMLIAIEPQKRRALIGSALGSALTTTPMMR